MTFDLIIYKNFSPFNPTSPAKRDHPNQFYLFDLLVPAQFLALFAALRKGADKKYEVLLSDDGRS